jgi:hypothetical protein
MTKVEIKKRPHLNKKHIEVDGKTYLLTGSKTHGRGVNKETDTLVFEEYDIKKYDSLIDELSSKISKKANVKEIIKQALYELPIKEIKKIGREMEKEKPKMRHEKGCAVIRIGKVPIMMRE